jgi:NitT/TauT family transport system permease protein
VRPYAQPIASILILFVLWELIVNLLSIPNYMLPAPTVIMARLVKDYAMLVQHGIVTASEITLGFALSFAVERTLYPILVFLQTVPKIAIAPLFVVWLGVGTFPKVLVAFLIAFFPIVIDSAVGLRTVAPEMIYLVRSMGAGPVAIFLKVRLPASLPFVFAGLKVAATLSVVGAIVGEFVGADKGLGYVLLVANGLLDTTLMFASLTVLTLLGLLLFYLLEFLEHLIIPWHVSKQTLQSGSKSTM